MPGLTGFPSCCGCDIINYFEPSPTDIIKFQQDPNNRDRWGNPLPLRDEKGDAIPDKTAKDGLIELVAEHSAWGGPKADRGFVCILNQDQLDAGWMEVLRELGFRFLCQWNNDVHGKRPNFLFALCKHNSKRKLPDPLQPPKGWDKLPEPDYQKVMELYDVKGTTLAEENPEGLDDYDEEFYGDEGEDDYY